MSLCAHGCAHARILRIALCCVLNIGLLVLASCGATSKPSASTTPNSSTPTSNPSPAPAPSPTPTSSSGGPVITAPANAASATSPVQFSGNVGTLQNVDHMDFVLDSGSTIMSLGYVPFANKWLFVPDGQHNVTLAAYSKNNTQLGASTVSLDVTGQVSPAVLPELQSIPAWQWCTADLNGSVCASGLGQATSTQTLDQTSPSLSGSSTLFTLGGNRGYSNALWWISLGGGTLLSQFTYDLDFYIDNASAPEALEFDVNQSFGGTRYTFGTECSYKNTHKWDVWDPVKEVWVVSSAPCPRVSSAQWHHLTWQFERVNGQVHYISVTLDGTTYPVNVYLTAEPNWKLEDVDVAFQMDGDYKQTPYKVWLDNVTLTTSY